MKGVKYASPQLNESKYQTFAKRRKLVDLCDPIRNKKSREINAMHMRNKRKEGDEESALQMRD